MIHPGYGFLSENAEFARKVEAAGIVFVGPTPEVIEGLGDKVSARTAAIKNNVPVVPGTDGPVEDVKVAEEFVQKYGYPVIIKAAFGGGGRGMRVVREGESITDAFQRATSEYVASCLRRAGFETDWKRFLGQNRLSETAQSSLSASWTDLSISRFSFLVTTSAMSSICMSVTARSSEDIRRSSKLRRPRIFRRM